MKLLLWLVLTAVNVEFLWCYSKSYENFKLYSVSCLSRSDVENIKLWEHRHQADFWSSPGINKTNNVLIDPSLQSKFEEFLSFGNFNYEILIENVGKNHQKSHTANKLKFHFPSGNFTDTVARDFSHYWTLPEIEDYINYLALSTDLNVRKLIIGRTTEGRKIHALTISLDETVGNQPILFIDAGIHAREWAGHMSVLYLLHQLVEKSSANLELLRNVDWVVVPVVNPDGFVYTFSNDRFWRKNRRQIVGGCVGVDINRNFGFGWKAASHEATPCSSSYPGPSPNSEPETRALADFMVQFKHKLKLYVSMHSYASILLYPYSFDFVYISNFKQHEDLCQMYVNAVNRITKFEPFTFGQSANEFYLASAVSDDYAVIAAKAEMAIVVELPGGGNFGYDFPEENLEALLMETFEGLKQFGAYVGNNFQ